MTRTINAEGPAPPASAAAATTTSRMTVPSGPPWSGP